MQVFKECLVLLICGLTGTVIGTTLFFLTPFYDSNILVAAFAGGFSAMAGLSIGHIIIDNYMS